MPVPLASSPSPVASFARFERRLARRVRLLPNQLSLLKLALALPIALVLRHRELDVAVRAIALTSLFASFAALDYLDGLVARERGLATAFGRFLDRATDLPVLLVLSVAEAHAIAALPLAIKLALDAVLLALYARGFGSTHNRLRTTASYVSLFALLMLHERWAPTLVTVRLVEALLWLNAGISLGIALRRLEVLRRRRIADALSLANLACGVLSMSLAARGELSASLFLLALGAAFDGFDGAAARRWGGSAWGVYMDDVADAVSYGLAPGYAIHATLGGAAGWVVGCAFTCFVVARLVFFTLSKGEGDPAVFRGVPSTVGGLVTLSSLVLFRDQPLVVGFFVGMACALMVSFDVAHAHLGRALASRHVRVYALGFAVVLALGAALGGLELAVSLVLAASLGYGLLPSVRRLEAALRKGRAKPCVRVSVADEQPASYAA